MIKKISTTALIATAALGISSIAQAGWSQNALNHQYNLQKHTPLVQSNIIGTHNSYSSNAYGMELYENQDLSITEQLEQGSRFLELDLWRNTKVESGAIVLCHNGGRCDGDGNADFVGQLAGLFTAFIPDDFIYLDSALVEIAKWAKENRDQIIVIKLEDQMLDWEYKFFEESLQRTVGEIVYRPERTSNSQACESFPSELTAAEMLDQGKQIIFTGYSGAACNGGGRSWAFKGTNSERDSEGYKNSGDEYRNCSTHGAGKYALFYDDAAEGDPAADGVMPDSAVRPLMKCGGTVFGFDWLKKNDNRIAEAVWSWAPNEPNKLPGSGAVTGVDCAVSYNGRFYDDNCNFNFAYSCSDGSGNWKVTQNSGAWFGGQAACRSEFGSDYNFDVPRTSKDNQLSEVAKKAAGKPAYWLNYSDSNIEGEWLSGADTAHLAILAVNDGLKVQSWNDYQWVYSDAGTDGDNNVSIWRGKNLPADWYRLGDTVGLATSGPRAYQYSRSPGSSLIALDDGSGKLAKPLSYEWRWNDWKTKGDTSVTLWNPIAPNGYTCLGGIAIAAQSRTQPSTDLMRCVRDDQLLAADPKWVWSDTGSGGEYGGRIYLSSYFDGESVPVGATANSGLSANTFLINTTDADRFKVLDSRIVDWTNGPKSVVVSAEQPAGLFLTAAKDYSWIYNDVNTGSDDAFSVWRPVTPAGFYRLGDFAQGRYGKPSTGAMIVKDNGTNDLAKPTGYSRKWTDAGSGGTHDLALWKPIAPAGYQCLGFLATSGAKPSTNDMRCVKENYLTVGKHSKVWDDEGSGSDTDVGIWRVYAKDSWAGIAAGTFQANTSHSNYSGTYKVLRSDLVLTTLELFQVTQEAAISGYNNESLRNVTPQQCAEACTSSSRASWCVSFDYIKTTKACDLSSKRASDVGGLKTNYTPGLLDHYSLR